MGRSRTDGSGSELIWVRLGFAGIALLDATVESFPRLRGSGISRNLLGHTQPALGQSQGHLEAAAKRAPTIGAAAGL